MGKDIYSNIQYCYTEPLCTQTSKGNPHTLCNSFCNTQKQRSFRAWFILASTLGQLGGSSNRSGQKEILFLFKIKISGGVEPP